MLKKSIAAAVLAFAAAAPAMAAPMLPSLSGLATSGRGMTGAFALPSPGSFKFAQAASAGQALSSLPGLSSGGGGNGAFLTVLKTGPATLLAVTPLSKSTEVLPRSGIGLSTYKFTKPSLKGRASGAKLNLGGNKNLVGPFAATLKSLPGTGLGVLKSGAGSLNTLPGDGVAQLRGLGL